MDDISLHIHAGESVAYVGPNGAGKSTTVKLLTGILVPTSGTVAVCGITPFDERVQNAKNISVVFGQRTQLWWDIPVIESFRLLVISMMSRQPPTRPLDPYSTAPKIVVSVVLPYAFMSYFPALLLLNRGGDWQRLGLASPVVAAVVVLVTSWSGTKE